MVKAKILEQFGLSEKEARVYLAVLELGGTGVQAIAARAGIHRVSTYDLLESLGDKGFVLEAKQDKRRIIRPVEPEQVAAAIRSKERLFSSLVPELSAIRDKGKGKPRTLYFEGRDGVWQALKNYLDRITTEPEILIYGSASPLLSEYRSELKSEARAFSAAGAKSKNLQEKTELSERAAQSASAHFGPIKYLPEDKKINGNIFIYKDEVLSVSWEELTAVIVDDKYNAANQRCIFNLLWELLP